MFKKLRRDREYIRRTQIKLPEMKATLSEMKNISEGINNQSRLQKKSVNFKITVDTTQKKKPREKKSLKMNRSPASCGTASVSLICGNWNP